MGIVALAKIMFAGFVELGNDESYYYTYALLPQLNYFDHPPMVGLLMRLSTFNLNLINDSTLRLGSIISCSIASLFLFKTTCLLYNKTAAWYATVIYNLSVYTGFIAGWFILPDSPQLLFWCASIYIMSKIVFQQREKQTTLWLLLGATIGMAVLSKVHGLYLWAGFGLFIIFYKTKWLFNWRMYISFIVTLVFTLPILIWNIGNDFITYRFHSQRVTQTHIEPDSFIREIMGEVLYQNPINFILLVLAVIFVLKNLKQQKETTAPVIESNKYTVPFLLFLSLPMIFLFWGVSLFNEILPHWSGPGYIPLYIIAGYYLSAKSKKQFPVWLLCSGVLVVVAIVGITLLANFAPFNLGSKDKESYGEYCPTLDISGWKDFSNEFDKLVKKDVESGKMKPNPAIVINNWFPACQLELYTSRKTGLRVIGLGELQDLHQFAWLNKVRKPLQQGDDAYCIVPSNLPMHVDEKYKGQFSLIEKPDTINQIRSGAVVRYFYIWRLKGKLF